METKAVKDGDHYVINGGKIWISNASFANVFIVFVNADVSKVSCQEKYFYFVNFNLSMNSMVKFYILLCRTHTHKKKTHTKQCPELRNTTHTTTQLLG